MPTGLLFQNHFGQRAGEYAVAPFKHDIFAVVQGQRVAVDGVVDNQRIINCFKSPFSPLAEVGAAVGVFAGVPAVLISAVAATVIFSELLDVQRQLAVRRAVGASKTQPPIPETILHNAVCGHRE